LQPATLKQMTPAKTNEITVLAFTMKLLTETHRQFNYPKAKAIGN